MELYDELSRINAFTVGQWYDPHVLATRDMWNPKGSAFDFNALLGNVDNLGLAGYIKGRFNEDALAHLLPRLYNLKGTETGLLLFLSMVGAEVNLYIGWKINAMRAKAAGARTEEERDTLAAFDAAYPNRIGVIDGGSILVDIEDLSQDLQTSFGNVGRRELEDQLLALADNFVWTGATLSFASSAFNRVRVSVKDALIFQMEAELGTSGNVNVADAAELEQSLSLTERLNVNAKRPHYAHEHTAPENAREYAEGDDEVEYREGDVNEVKISDSVQFTVRTP